MKLRERLYDIWYEQVLCRFWFRWWTIDHFTHVDTVRGKDPKHLRHMMPSGFRHWIDARRDADFLMWIRGPEVSAAIKAAADKDKSEAPATAFAGQPRT